MTNHNHNHNPNHNKIIPHHHNNLLPSTTTTRSNSTIQACAACRYQRRKCAPDCILAPYFPHDRQRQFQNAHKLFGVSNITKIIRNLDQPQKDEAMRTIIYQSDVRAQDPVGGCYRIIRELHRQIEISRAELEIVLQQLAYCRTLAVQNHTQNHPHFNQDQIVIDEVDCDIHLVNNPEDGQLYDDSSVDHLHRRNSLDLDLDNIPLQQQEHKNHDQYVSSKQDSNEQETVWQNDHVSLPVQSWAAVHDSPPSAANCFDAKPQPFQTLHASVCDDFKSLLLNDIPPGEKIEFRETNVPSDESLFNEEHHKALIKEENVSYKDHNEDHEVKNATFATLQDCKATHIEGE
ncbi:hypothetical protein L2E82_02596 [Cichorium intybus]|uniref:Uncharacterized protein n=1 Tax=Cichorium intybus TaxID=13427 RepID=A0ACB9H482_CICIN|nr:hypothetical protein L2E82_02596 [Cichorium intybus]